MAKPILRIKSTGEFCVFSGTYFSANQIGKSSTLQGNEYLVVELLDPDFFPSGMTKRVSEEDLEIVPDN